MSFWTVFSTYCSELAPVTGPLLTALSDTASAIEQAGVHTAALNAASDTLERELARAGE